MKLHTFIMLGSTGVTMTIGSDASASYLGLSVTSQEQTVGGVSRNVFRVYANFSDPNDYLVEVFGSPALGNLVIHSRNLSDTGPGSNFVNVAGAGDTAPSRCAINS